MNSTVVWTIVGVLIVLALVLVAVRMGAKKKQDSRRVEAGEMRQAAASDERTIQTHRAEAAEQEALAREARAESDRKAAAADKLDLQAQERSEQASGKQAEQHDRLRTADEIDPDVPDRDPGDDASAGGLDGDHPRHAEADRNAVDGPRDGTDTRTTP